MADTESRTVGKSEPITLPPMTVVVPGDTPQGGTDNPTTRQSDNAPRAKVVAPLLLLAVVVVTAGGVLAVHQWGWWGLAVAGVAVVVVLVAGFRWWRAARRRMARSTTARTGRTGGGRSGGPGTSRTGGSRRRGILGRLGARAGGTGPGSRGGILSRLGIPGRGRSRRSSGTSQGRAAPGRTGRRGSVMGRGPRLGRGGSLLSTGSGPNLGGRSRGSKLFGGRRGRARRTPGISRSGGGHMLTAPSLPSLAATKKALKTADRAVGRTAGRGWFATAGAVTDAIASVKPGHTPHHQGDTMSGIQRSRFEQITETLPQEAFTDPITEHDMGIDPMVDGMERGFAHVAEYVDNVTKRLEAENYAGTEPIVLDALGAVARMVRASGAVTDEAHKILKSSPSHQDMLKRMAHANGAKSDVEAARRAGLV